MTQPAPETTATPEKPVHTMPQPTLDDLRAILADEIYKIREGNTTAATVNAISNATGKILSTVKLQMEYHRLTGRTIDIPLLGGSTNGTEDK